MKENHLGARAAAVPVPAMRARELARDWVTNEGTALAGFGGAYLTGSVATLPGVASVPPTSDVDVTVIVEAAPATKLGKFSYCGVLLEVSFVAWEQLQAHELILGHSQMAAAIQFMRILADPSGQLARLQGHVAKQYASRHWVRKRCQHAARAATRYLTAAGQSAPWHDRVSSWLFGTSLFTVVLAVSGLRVPTVRRRFVEARELLALHGKLEFYESILQLVGCAHWSESQATYHVTKLANAFDSAKELPKSNYRFAADISDASRPVAIDGSIDLIVQGLHREAVFWIVATYSRCQWIFSNAGSAAMVEQFDAGYRRLLGDLGIHAGSDLEDRSRQVLQALPQLHAVADSIMAATPAIRKDRRYPDTGIRG